MKITDVSFQTRHLEDQKVFYGDVLGLPIRYTSDERAAFRAGATSLIFVHDGGNAGDDPTYHFAFDVPRNRFAQAKAWLSERAELLVHDYRNEFEFPPWNARACYVRDPAGNLLELIARRSLPNDSDCPFDAAGLLCVSEVGVVVEDVPSTVEALRNRFGLGVWNAPHEEFTTVGDETGLVVVVRRDRPWFPTEEPARAFPLVSSPRPRHRPPDCSGVRMNRRRLPVTVPRVRAREAW